MAILNLSPDELLTTTRSVRKRLQLDHPIDLGLVRECVEVALQAPTGLNEQGWHFVVVEDRELREGIASVYKRAWDSYSKSPAFSADTVHADDPERRAILDRIVSSIAYLAEHLARVPVLVIPCVAGRVENVPQPFAVATQASTYGSILPAAWSFMLAARARNLGTAWTTLHLLYEEEVADLLGIPFNDVTQVALIPVAQTLGSAFKPARRKPVESVLHSNRW